MKIRKTLSACPTQWEGTLDDGRQLYFRYRGGWMELYLYSSQKEFERRLMWRQPDVTEQLGDYLDGYLSDEDVLTIIRAVIGDEQIEVIP